MTRLVFDIETDGFVEKMTRVHCLVTQDVDTGEISHYYGETLQKGLKALQKADEVIGHNIIEFDIPAIQKIFPLWQPEGKVTDTLVMSRLIYANIREIDFTRVKKSKSYLPGRLIGSHGLEAWGHRLKFHKGDYAKEMKDQGLDPWANFSDLMLDYCVNDVELNTKLYQLLISQGFSEKSIDLEHAVFNLCRQQTLVGCGFDRRAAEELYLTLTQRKLQIERELRDTFPPWFAPQGRFVPKRSNSRMGYIEGVPLTKVELVEFNPASRAHIADRLRKYRGWKPSEMTETGQPKVDESVLKKLPWPEAKLLTEYLMLTKRLGQLGDGKEAWLKLEKNGRIHGRINTNGAVTGRCTHSRPNLAQVPAVRAPFGRECRELFVARDGWKFVGADASGLELRCLAHYLARWDGGDYANEVLNGDIHTANQKAAGLALRDQAKTFIYALLYGAGDGKIGEIIGRGPRAGKKLREQFMEAMPAFKRLISAVQTRASHQGYVKGLDGRRLMIRSAHSALNTLLQGAGAVIMKQAMVNFHQLCIERGLLPGVHYNQVLFVHDEFQCETLPEYAEMVGQCMVDGIRQVTDDFDLRCPLDGEYKIGNNWAETH